jgi:hypothetical protein
LVLAAAALVTAGLFSSPAPAPELPPATAAEVERLLGVLGNSQCRFYRNGTWYDGPEAQAHLRNKYDYLVKKRLVHSAEDFIVGAGEKSSLSGQPYKVQCTGQDAAFSGPWLRDRLVEIRRTRQDATDLPARKAKGQ